MHHLPSNTSPAWLSKQSTSGLPSAILTAHEKTKFRDRDDAITVAINLIGQISVLLNLRGDAALEPARVQMLAEGVVRYHGNWSAEEIFLACEMNQYGKLSPKVEHYNQLTPDYISAVLHLYSEEKKATILKSRMKSAEKSNLDLNWGRAPEAMYQAIVDFVKVAGRLPDYWDWHLVYDYLTEHRLIEDWTPARKRELKERMEERVKAEQAKGRMTSLASIAFRDLSGKDFHDRVVMECKKFIVLEYLKKYLEHKS